MRLELKEYDGVVASRVGTWQVEFTLSRRNLLTLLHVLNARGSALRIESNEAYLHEGHIANTTVVVRCESDEEHYSHPLRGLPAPGRMDADSEAFIAEHYVPEEHEHASLPLCQPSEGVRPAVHEPDRKHAWVYQQDRLWVDYHGCEHDIDRMTRRYVESVLDYIRAMPFDLIQLLAPEFDVKEELDEMMEIVDDWVESLPVVVALERRLQALDEAGHTADADDAEAGS